MSETDAVIDPQDFRRVLGNMPTGVTIVTANSEQGPVGVAIGSFVSISLDPPLVGFFLGNQSGSGVGLKDAGHFCVNILAQDQMDLCGTMASRAEDKFEKFASDPSPGTGSPIFPGIRAYVDCEIDSIVPVGDHDLFVGRVVALDTVTDAEPMIFDTGRYGTFGSTD